MLVSVGKKNTVIVTDGTWGNGQVIPQNPAWVTIEGADYIWNEQDLGSESGVFSKTFNLKKRVRSAILYLSTDNYASVLINGIFVTNDLPQDNPPFYREGRVFDVTSLLRTGDNDIVIAGFNFCGPPTAENPAGIAARLEISHHHKKDDDDDDD